MVNHLSPQPGPERARRTWHYVLPLALLGLAVHTILPQMTTLSHSLQVITGMMPWAVALAIAMQVLSYLGSGYLLQAIAPGGTTAVLAARNRDLCRRIECWAGGWWTGGQCCRLALLGLVAGTVLWGVNDRPRFIALATRMGRWWARLRRRAYEHAPTEVAVRRLFGAWDMLRGGGWHGLIMGAVANIVFDMGTLYLLFVAAGRTVSPGILLAGYGLPLLLGKVSFLPGGVGIVEGAMAVLYDGLGVPGAVTVVVILAYRLISFWLPTLAGLPLAAYLQRAIGQIKDGGA